MKRYYFHDCETGGFSTNCSLLTYYGVCLEYFNGNFHIVEEINLSIKAPKGEYVITPGALEVNKIDLVAHEKVSVPVEVASEKLFDFLIQLGTPILCGQNVQFDNQFMEKNFPGFLGYFSRHTLDTASLAIVLRHIGKIPQNVEPTLEFLAKWYKIDAKEAHNAKNDTWTTIAVFQSMLRDLQGA